MFKLYIELYVGVLSYSAGLHNLAKRRNIGVVFAVDELIYVYYVYFCSLDSHKLFKLLEMYQARHYEKGKWT